jgi:hypothetical protein
MHFPHWLIIAGGAMIVLGIIGFALRENNAESNEDNLNQEVAPEERTESGHGLIKRLSELRKGNVSQISSIRRELPNQTSWNDDARVDLSKP